jgi:hypothetical protein
MSLSTNGEFDAHILRIDRNQELKKKFGISYTRFAEIDPTPIKKWLVKDFLGAGEMSCAYGPPGSAKSLLAGDLAAHVAWGQDWMGRRVSQGAVLFVAIERAGLVKRRLAGISQHHGIAELPLAVLSGSIDLCHGRSGVDGILECAKRLTDGAEGERVSFAIESVELDQDPITGDVTSAPVLRPTEAPKATAREPELSKNAKTMFALLQSAGSLSTEEWNERARDAGIGVKRRADLVDIRLKLKSKHLVREYNDQWSASV